MRSRHESHAGPGRTRARVASGAGELERRLLDFVGRIGSPGDGPPAPIHPETALFEEGIVDSLRLLDLIAFVEELTGSPIPDSAVRLASFRSVRAIATAFGEPGGRARKRAADASEADEPPVVVFERLSDRAGPGRPVPKLAARGELALFAPGRVALHGLPARLLDYFDRIARSWAAEVDAAERPYPALVPRELLARAGRPVDPAPAGSPVDPAPAGTRVDPAPGRRVRPSAACYHVYGDLAGSRLDRAPVLVTTRGTCFRNETELDPARGRLRVFEMREIVTVGSRADAEDLRWEMIGRVRGLMEELDLTGRLETASDPFFLPEPAARGRRLMQGLLPLKYELRLPLDAGGPGCAVASFNHHLDFFGRRFGIRLATGATAHSGCVAFGLERWVLAFVARHGSDARSWPATVREFCAPEVKRERVS